MVAGENLGLRLLMTALHVHRLWDTEKNNNHNLYGGSSCQMWFSVRSSHQALVVQTLDSAIHRINHYPVDKY